jgi:outer membrane cobalamin receptor
VIKWFALATILIITLRGIAAAVAKETVDGAEIDSTDSSWSVSELQTLVISEEDIEKSRAAVLGEILNRIAGLEVIDTGYLGAGKEASFEGFPPGHLLYILDGEVINDPQGNSLDLNMIPISAIERIEITRHPTFLDRGTRAVGGVVRITTRRFQGGDPFTRLVLAGGSLGTNILRGEFRRGVSDEAIGISLSFERISSDLFVDDGDQKAFKYNLGVSEDYWDGIDLGLSVNGTNATSTLGEEGADSTTAEFDREFRSVNAYVKIDPGGALPLELSVYYSKTARDSLDPVISVHEREIRGDRKGVRLQGTYQEIRGMKMVVGMGEEYLSSGGEGESKTFSFFSGGECTVGFLPEIDFMGRWEREGSLFSAWSGGLKASKPLGGHTSLFASILQARHRPSLEERNDPGSSSNFEKERVFETGLLFRFHGIDNSMTWFGRWSQDGMDQPDNSDDPGLSSSDEWREFGWRWVTRGDVSRHISCSLGYQRLDVQEFPAGEIELAIPKHYLTGTVDVHGSLKGDDLGYNCRISGVLVRGKDRPSTTLLTGDKNYQFADVNIGFRMVDVTFFYTIRNLFDSRYEIIGGFPVPGRVSRFGFTWNFFD